MVAKKTAHKHKHWLKETQENRLKLTRQDIASWAYLVYQA